MSADAYQPEMIEVLWDKLPEGGSCYMENGTFPVCLLKTSEEQPGASFCFPGNIKGRISSSSVFMTELEKKSGKAVVRILKNSKSDKRIFSSFIANLLELSYNTRELDQQKRFDVLKHRITAWQRFMKVKDKRLSMRMQLNIFGQLIFLEYLLDKQFPYDSIAALWRSPLEGGNYFLISDNESIAVKTSVEARPFLEYIGSLEELEILPQENLFLAAIHCVGSENGIKIPELVERIKNKLCSASERFELDGVLTALGLDPFTFEDFEYYKFAFQSLKFFNAEDVPRILPTTVPGVTAACYSILLTDREGRNCADALSPQGFYERVVNRK